MEFQLHDNVDIDALKVGRPRGKYPFPAMAVGQAFFVPVGENEPKAVLQRMRSASTRWVGCNTEERGSIKFAVAIATDPVTGAPAIVCKRVE